ncbi:hypothetical protein PC129_g10201 [Phytophthora cactorum]|uniref:Uncharacterized protein n=1 Tax=Phytophthora cactorum TaxID=29920 RepID=A0A8T1I3H8_9STRA|nr:hypothetical protein PC129_g10201 [Phytophthora cactorum]
MAGGALLYHELKLVHCVDLGIVDHPIADALVIPEGYQVDSDEFTIAGNGGMARENNS